MKRTRWRRWRDYVTGWSIKYDIYTSFRAQTEHRAWKDSRAWKNSQLRFRVMETWRFWARNTFERENSRRLISTVFALLLCWEYFFFFLYTDTLKIRQLKAIVREHPSSFLTAVSIKKVRKMRKKKVIEYYILILIDLISCNNKMESKGIEYFFFYRCTLLFIVTPFDIIIKINVLKVNCFYRVIQLDYALRL